MCPREEAEPPSSLVKWLAGLAVGFSVASGGLVALDGFMPGAVAWYAGLGCGIAAYRRSTDSQLPLGALAVSGLMLIVNALQVMGVYG